MDKKKTADKVEDDEVVQFISHRHHASASDVLASLALQADGKAPVVGRQLVDLEENEIRIIRDLIDMYHQ